MKLRDFPLFADENLIKDLVEFLRTEEFDVKWVREEGLVGWKDKDLMPIAFSEKRVIVAQDSDFGKLIFTQGADFVEIIYLRPGHFPAKKHIETIEAILTENPDLEPPFILTA